jgi:hypothetical protein
MNEIRIDYFSISGIPQPFLSKSVILSVCFKSKTSSSEDSSVFPGNGKPVDSIWASNHNCGYFWASNGRRVFLGMEFTVASYKNPRKSPCEDWGIVLRGYFESCKDFLRLFAGRLCILEWSPAPTVT